MSVYTYVPVSIRLSTAGCSCTVIYVMFVIIMSAGSTEGRVSARAWVNEVIAAVSLYNTVASIICSALNEACVMTCVVG